MSGRGRQGRSPTRRGAVLVAVTTTAAVGLVGGGVFASFTSAATGGPQAVASGTVTIALGATGAQTNRLTVNATGVAPGDSIYRSVDLTNSGTLNLASVTLTTSATASSLLDTDATNGLQLQILRCSQAWTESGTSPSFTYSCGGTSSTVLASTSVTGAGRALSNLGSTTAGATDHLEVVLTLPTTSPTTMQGLTSTITFACGATQRGAQAD